MPTSLQFSNANRRMPTGSGALPTAPEGYEYRRSGGDYSGPFWRLRKKAVKPAAPEAPKAGTFNPNPSRDMRFAEDERTGYRRSSLKFF